MTFDTQKQQIPSASFGPPAGQIAAGAAESEGTSTQVPRADHVHAFPLSGNPAAGGRLAVETVDPVTLQYLPGPGLAVLAANPPSPGVVYQNGLSVAVAVTLGVTVTASTTAAATVSLGVSAANPPTAEQIASIPDTLVGAVTHPVTFIVPPGWYWLLDVSSPGAAAVIGTAQAVTL